MIESRRDVLDFNELVNVIIPPETATRYSFLSDGMNARSCYCFALLFSQNREMCSFLTSSYIMIDYYFERKTFDRYYKFAQIQIQIHCKIKWNIWNIWKTCNYLICNIYFKNDNLCKNYYFCRKIKCQNFKNHLM